MNPRLLFLTTCLLTLAFAGPAVAQAADSPTLRLKLGTEDARPANLKIYIQTDDAPEKILKTLESVPTGSTNLSLSGIPDGNYLVFFKVPGHASLWKRFTLKQAKATPDNFDIQLFRKRYVVMRYAFNTAGGRELTGNNVEEGRLAASHWRGLPNFHEDWQIWQKDAVPHLSFHRINNGFGFAKPPAGVAFADLKEAPAQAKYECVDVPAEKGQVFFCRIEGDRKEGLGYGKFIVEDITDTPPPGVEVNEAP